MALGQNLAERGRFELPIRLPVCRISSAVHSTTLPPLRMPRSAVEAGWIAWRFGFHKRLECRLAQAFCPCQDLAITGPEPSKWPGSRRQARRDLDQRREAKLETDRWAAARHAV